MEKFIGSNGQYFTRQLFWEEWIKLETDKRLIPKPPFCLYKDREGYINFGREYVNFGDPTGYKLAHKYLDGYRHWQSMMGCRWFTDAKTVWDQELDARLSSEALERIRDVSQDDEAPKAVKLAASKFLANKEYKKSPETKGRPKNEDIQRAARTIASAEKDFEEDFKRIGGML